MPAPRREDSPARRRSDRSEATRNALLEFAAEMFAENGYAQTSMRDIARDGPVSLGAIYLHFKSKADLLVEAIETKIDQQLENAGPTARETDSVKRLTDAARDAPARRELRALLVQAAAASQTDDETSARVREAQTAHIDDWIVRYEENRKRLRLDDGLDIPTAVLYIWAAELGLGMLEAFGIEPTSAEEWSDLQNRLARSMRFRREV